MDINQKIEAMANQAKHAAAQLSLLNIQQKNDILISIADSLNQHRNAIKIANRIDVSTARRLGMSSALLDRLKLTDERIDGMIDGFKKVAQLPDPIGKKLNEIKKENGLVIRKVRVPIGVIGMIYESRPNVTADVSALCLKSGNAVILRGGSESINSNVAISKAILEGGKKADMPEFAVQLVDTTEREAVRVLVQLTGKIDLVIPRGGEELINAVVEMAKVPVIKHYKGLCHLYVDESADLEKAVAIAENAKCQRPGVCNAIETLLVHENIAISFLPDLAKRLKMHQVKLKGDKKTRKILPRIQHATDKDWDTEYLDLILSIRMVQNIDEAIAHINTHGSHHSDAIVSESKAAQDKFAKEVDSAVVYINASTRFTDGAEFGMGAEIGISTDKLHARGPMGLEELTTYKYIAIGDGQVR